MKFIIEKKHRLALPNYCGLIRASFSIWIKNRIPVFTDNVIVSSFVEILRTAREKYICENWAYVFMPDHVHIVLEGTHDQSNLWKTIVLFKQKSGYWFTKNMPSIKWQKDFYDHIHRIESELINHILYLANNPVRKNLVEHWKQYPFTGSLDNDLTAIIWE